MNNTDNTIVELYYTLATVADEHYPELSADILQACNYAIAFNLDYRLPGPVDYDPDTALFTGFQTEKEVISPKSKKTWLAGEVIKGLMDESETSAEEAYKFFCFSRAKISHEQNVEIPARNNMITSESVESAERALREQNINEALELFKLQCSDGVVPRDDEATYLVEMIMSICDVAVDAGLSAPDIFRMVYVPETIRPV